MIAFIFLIYLFTYILFCLCLCLYRQVAAGNNAGKVVYWMQHTTRLEDNLAFEAAIMLSNRVCLPLVVVVRSIYSYQSFTSIFPTSFTAPLLSSLLSPLLPSLLFSTLLYSSLLFSSSLLLFSFLRV